MPNAFTNAINSLTGEPPAPTGNMMTRALNNVRDSNATAAMQNAVGVPAADSLCPSLSFKQRLYGCIGCFCVGIFLSIIGWFAWIGARARATPRLPAQFSADRATSSAGGHIGTFGVTYTLGNIVSLCSTGFLIGPKRQCRQMSKARRRTATAIYLTMMLSTVVTALMDGPSILILLFCFLQWCALVWYIASYIPYGQKIISKCLGKAANSAANSVV